MNNFNEFNLPSFLIKSLDDMKITTPTPVQAQAIPIALQGKNILASAQTGTGKTIAYLVPIIARLSENPQGKAIILTPTRELAIQVQDSARKLLGRPSSLNTALLIGGEALPKQLMQLRKNPKIIIGTPGRINDLLDRTALRLDDANFLVLDEVDRMLDMGFAEQLETIVKHIPAERQTLMFSATMPTNIERLAQKYLVDPQRIIVGVENQPVAKIKQDIIYTTNSEKFNLLSKELESREGFIIIFVKTKHRAEQLADTLKDNSHNVRAIHGGLRQQKRERVIRDFRERKSRIMVATDIAARGLDVPHIQHVINYDLPQCPEDYLHRIGRTGRAGAEGFALSLVSPDEEGKWRAINRLMSDNEFESTGFARGPRSGGSSSSSRSSRPRRSFGDKSFGDKPFGERRATRRFDRSEGGRPSFGGSERSEGGRSFGNSDRSEGGRSFGGDRPFRRERRPFGGEAQGERSFNRPERPQISESGSNERRFNENPHSSFSEGRRFNDKPFGERSQGGFDRSRGPRDFSRPRRSSGGFGGGRSSFGGSESGQRSFSRGFPKKKQSPFISES